MPELKPISENSKATGLSRREEFAKRLTKLQAMEDLYALHREDGNIERAEDYNKRINKFKKELWNWILKECVFKDDVRAIGFNQSAEGCGLEDAGITDRYEAMEYGWEQAIKAINELTE